MWFVTTKRGPFKTKEEACKHASPLMHYIPEIYEVGVIELPLKSAQDSSSSETHNPGLHPSSQPLERSA